MRYHSRIPENIDSLPDLRPQSALERKCIRSALQTEGVAESYTADQG